MGHLSAGIFLVITKPMDSVLLVTWLIILTAVCFTLAGPVLFLLFSAIALVQTFALRIIRIERGEIPGAIIDELKENRGNK